MYLKGTDKINGNSNVFGVGSDGKSDDVKVKAKVKAMVSTKACRLMTSTIAAAIVERHGEGEVL